MNNGLPPTEKLVVFLYSHYSIDFTNKICYNNSIKREPFEYNNSQTSDLKFWFSGQRKDLKMCRRAPTNKWRTVIQGVSQPI